MAIKQTGGTRLSGINPLSYTGVDPVSPPQLVRFDRQPTNRDFGFNIGDLWLVAEPVELWILLEKPQNVAFWGLVYPQAGGAGGISLIHTDAGDVVADVNGEIGLIGGENINVAAADANTVAINLNRTIDWPSTNASETEGMILLEGTRFLHNYGQNGLADHNTFLGSQSGDLTLMGTDNTGIGYFTLGGLTTGSDNTALGSGSLVQVDSGSNNIALGANSGTFLTNGSFNIMIGNAGHVGDDNKIRIGNSGIQDATFIAGIFGQTVAATVTANTVLNIDDDGQIGQLELTSLDGSIDITQTDNGHLDFSVVESGSGGALTPNNFSTNFSVPFLGIMTAVGQVDIPNGAKHFLGSLSVLTVQYDIANAFFPGNGVGSRARFTAPANGYYSFTIGANVAAPSICGGIQVNNITRYEVEIAAGSSTNITFNIQLTLNDIVTFFVTPTSSVIGTVPLWSNGKPVGTIAELIVNQTFVSGYRIG